MNKLKCIKCNKPAVWMYMAGEGEYCDEHVPRGCSCQEVPKDGNWDNIDEANWVNLKDDLGRDLPCVEYNYEKDGFDEDYYK